MTPNWTNERPTKPGEYWLSVKPSNRAGILPKDGYPHAVNAFQHADVMSIGVNGIEQRRTGLR